MTREDFDKQLAIDYQKIVRSAQAELVRQGVQDIQAEDVVSRIVLEIWSSEKRLDSVKGMGYFRPAIRNRILDHIRDRKRAQAREEQAYQDSISPSRGRRIGPAPTGNESWDEPGGRGSYR